MKIEINAPLTIDNRGIEELLKLVGRKGRIFLEFKKGKIIIEDLPSEKIDRILSILRENFDITSLDLNNEKKFKLRNDEKQLQSKKKKIAEDIAKKPTTIVSQVKQYILREKVFSLTQLRESFPKTNFATLRSYVNDMKNEQIIVEIERGKYSVR